MPTTTTNFGFSKPLVNDASDQDLWGGYLNTDMDSIDGLLLTSINFAKSSKTIDFSVTAPTAGTNARGDAKKLFLCDGTAGVFSATLPSAASAGDGFVVAFKKTDGTANAITILASAGQTIDGGSSYPLSAQYDWVVLVANGVSNWNIISKTPPIIQSATAPDKTLIGNVSGSTAVPSAVTLSNFLDNILGSAQGSIIYRGASNWAALSYGTAGQLLKTQGASANPSWITPTYVLQDQNYNAVGSLCLCQSTGTIAAGSTVAGSLLKTACLTNNGLTGDATINIGTSLTGTWRCLGIGSGTSVTLFQRIA